jgi:peptidoglycan-associated lipoprotein
MMRRTSLIAIAALLSLNAGCAHRRTAANLPPQPPSSSEVAENAGDHQGNVTGAVIPGSRRDFIQSVPSDRVFFDTDS